MLVQIAHQGDADTCPVQIGVDADEPQIQMGMGDVGLTQGPIDAQAAPQRQRPGGQGPGQPPGE
jgi:hypothetical protein